MLILNILFIIVGLVALVGGADVLVRGAASLANRLRVSALIIGLTVVSFGTSAPELTVNIVAALNGSPDLALGNIIGSNIANIFLILGITSVIAPLTVKSNTVWKEIPLALLGVVLLLVMGNDRFIDGVEFNAITRTDGLVLISLMGIFMYYIIGMARAERQESSLEDENEEIKQYSVGASIGLTVAGLGALIVGGQVLVSNAVAIAQAAGLSEALIGLTIVGIGTSLPELATSVVAALKKHTDIAIGNAVGSNIFNVLWVIGVTSVILQLPFDAQINVDILVSIGATLLLFIYMFIGKRRSLGRYEGVSFLVLYAMYLAYLFMRG